MTTRGQFIDQGIEEWVKMEARWQGKISRENVAAPDAQGSSVQVLATDLVRFSALTFPTPLRVQIVEARTETRDIQSKIRQRKAPVARIKSARETDNPAFGELIRQLKGGGFAVEQPDIQGHPERFLLAPLGDDLLCTVLPVSDIEALRTQRSGRTMPHVAAQDQFNHLQWENTFAPPMDAIKPPTLPHSGTGNNGGLLGGQQTGEGGGFVWTLNFDMGGGGSGSESVDQVGAFAMFPPSADLQATEDFDMDAYVNWGSDGDS